MNYISWRWYWPIYWARANFDRPQGFNAIDLKCVHNWRANACSKMSSRVVCYCKVSPTKAPTSLSSALYFSSRCHPCWVFSFSSIIMQITVINVPFLFPSFPLTTRARVFELRTKKRTRATTERKDADNQTRIIHMARLLTLKQGTSQAGGHWGSTQKPLPHTLPLCLFVVLCLLRISPGFEVLLW